MIQVHSPHFITAQTEQFTIDILGGVDIQQVDRMICTLRISYKDYPPMRSTLDLYNDNQTDKLIRTICDKWELQLLDVSKTVHTFITELEKYKLERLKYPKQVAPEFELSEQQAKNARQFLKSKNLLSKLTKALNEIGILGEDENAIILFLSLCSHKFSNPFSVICLAKSGIGKSYLLQKLSECMPLNAYSFHTRISANSLYYFDNHQINNKALFIEDLEWTKQMLQPLSTLQTQGRLINTRATKNKDGMMHSTTFEVTGNLCLLACAYPDKNYESLPLPFLTIHLNHSHSQDLAIMDYQRKVCAGLINKEEIKHLQQLLKSVVTTLEPVQVINPFAPLIELPEDVAHPRKSLLLLLNFIEVITYFFQQQRTEQVNEETGEVNVLTHPDDIELAFKLLKNNLFRRADELSTSVRGFYNWLEKYLKEAQTNQFTTLDIRKAKNIHPRTLNRYLQELKLYSYIQVIGGNKHREGFIYKITQFGNQTDVQTRIEKGLQSNLDLIKKMHKKETDSRGTRSVSQKPVSNSKTLTKQTKDSRTTTKTKNSKQ